MRNAKKRKTFVITLRIFFNKQNKVPIISAQYAIKACANAVSDF